MLRFTNDSSRIYLARKGPASVFGRDVDTRESLPPSDAIALFNRIWTNQVEREITYAPKCSIESVFERLFESAKPYVELDAEHREFRIANCLFIAQLRNATECDELWFVSSSSADPRTLYVKFNTVADHDEFSLVASQHGWNAHELALELLHDFVRKDRRRPEAKKQNEPGIVHDRRIA